MSTHKRYWRLSLDYDDVPYEDVDQDAKRLIKDFPELGNNYEIESSKSGQAHFHVIFHKSKFASFEEAYHIALQSKCDKDWLSLCKEYETFGLETAEAQRFNEARQQKIVNKPMKMITLPFLLDLVPASPLDARRIVKVCEAIADPTWQYSAFVHVWDLTTHVQIGCRDEKQANRRMKWLSEQDLGFTANVKRNPIK